MRTRGLLTVGAAVAMTMLVKPAFAQDPNSGSMNTMVISAPPADRPLLRGEAVPMLSVEGGAGILGYLGGTATPGPAWNIRVGTSFSERWGLEANYVGSANSRSDRTGTLVYTSLDAQARYNILRADQAPVQPFLTAGLGYAGFAGPGGDGAALVLPVSLGMDRLLTRHIKIGARFNLRPALFDDLSHENARRDDVATGGSTWNLVANLGGAF